MWLRILYELGLTNLSLEQVREYEHYHASTSPSIIPAWHSNRLPAFEYDIALSFAGENRNYVGRVAENLRSSGVRVFYDEFKLVDLWGKSFYVYLDEIYRKKARYCILFLSKHYAEKVWTNHERESAQARAFLSNQEYILPARFDSTEIPGVLPTVAYVDLTKLTAEEFTTVILEKIGKLTGDRSIVPTIETRRHQKQGLDHRFGQHPPLHPYQPWQAGSPVDCYGQKQPRFIELAVKHYRTVLIILPVLVVLGLFAGPFLKKGEEHFQHTLSKTQDGSGGTFAKGTSSSPTHVTETQDSRGTSAQDTPTASITITKKRNGKVEPIPELKGTH